MSTRQRSKPYCETPAYLAALQRMLAALGRRVGDADVEMLPALARVADDANELLGIAARQLHDQHGYSWTQIGRVLGTSKQAAQKRFRRQPCVDARPVVSR